MKHCINFEILIHYFFFRYADIGANAQKNDQLPLAKEALVFMIVPFNKA